MASPVVYKHLVVYAPPSWASFELRVEGGKWATNSWEFGTYRVRDLESQMVAMDEFLKLVLRTPLARVYFEDEMGNEREGAWLEYALHRLNDKPRGITGGASDAQLRKWGYWSEGQRERDAIRLGLAAIREWKLEGA